MKIRSAGLSLSAASLALVFALGTSGCGGKDDNANNANTRANTNTTVNMATPVTASEDTAIKNKTEANLSKEGVSGVTVEVKEGVVTLKGDVPEANFQKAVKAANESGAKRVMNQLNKK